MTALRRATLAIALTLGATLAAPAALQAQPYPTAVRTQCVGGAIGCQQVDFFLDFLTLPAGQTLVEQFTLTLQNGGWLFAGGTTEAEDALGFNFYTPTVLNGGLGLRGVFDFGAIVDPAVTPTFRVRADFTHAPDAYADATPLRYAYELTSGGATVGRGTNTPPPVDMPEPTSLAVVALGLGGLALRRGRARPT